jgi:hypothetical protein
LEYHNQSFVWVFEDTLVLVNPLFTISTIYDLCDVSLDSSFNVFGLNGDIALAQGSVGDNIQGTKKGVTPRLLLMWME